MPSTVEIQKEAEGARKTFAKYMSAFSKRTGRNIIVYYSGFLFANGKTSIDEDDMNGFMAAIYRMDKARGLDLFLHTPGGSVAATEGIGDYLHSVFGGNIECYIPHMAMSCGTLLAMSCRKIFMGKHSCLGPIDPAIGPYRTDAVVEELDKAKKEIAANPHLALFWQPIISKYAPTFYGECEKATQLATIVAEKWLKGGMLAGSADADERFSRIAELFASHKSSKAHDRHIPADVAAKAGLSVSLIEKDDKLQDAVMSVHHSAILFMKTSKMAKIITNKSFIGQFEINQ